MNPSICLINPPSTGPEDKAFFPLSLLALGAYLKADGITASVLDFDLLSRQKWFCTPTNFLSKAVAKLRKSGCRVFGITTICANFPIALLLAERLKKALPDCTIILGGPQASAVAAETLRDYPCVDFVISGEGEIPLSELLRSAFDPAKLPAIKSLTYRDGDVIVQTPAQPLMENLDVLPFPDYSLVNMDDYHRLFQSLGVTFSPSIEAGRGCPFRCTFCSTKSMWAQSFRIKSPARLLEEMRHFEKLYGYKDFELVHDNFTTSKSYTLEVCDYFIAHNAQGYTWSTSSRLDCVDVDRINLLAQAGCNCIFFGIESASDRVQRDIKKGLKLERFEPILSRMAELKMCAITSFIIGFPSETVEDIEETLSRGYEYSVGGAPVVFFNRLSPLSGTELTRTHFDELVLIPGASPINRDCQRYHPKLTGKMIAKNKTLFTACYLIPTPNLPDLDLEDLALFYRGILAQPHLRDKLGSLFEHGDKPMAIFLDWISWLLDIDPELTLFGGHKELGSRFENFIEEQSAAATDDRRVANTGT